MIKLTEFLILLLELAVQLYLLVVLAYCVATFFVRNRYAPWFVLLADLVEPPLVWIRKVTKGYTQTGGIDFAPMVLAFSLWAALRLLHL